MKMLALAAVVAAGPFFTAGTAHAQLFRNRGTYDGGCYYSYPTYSYSTYGYPSYSYSYGYPTHSYATPSYSNGTVTTSGYTPSATAGTVVAGGYTPVNTSGAVIAAVGNSYSGPVVGSTYSSPAYVDPTIYYMYPFVSYDNAYPAYFGGMSSRRLFGWSR